MKVQVVVNFHLDEDADADSLVSVAASLIQQAFANIPGVSLVAITEVKEQVHA